jgi:hypothetical protein
VELELVLVELAAAVEVPVTDRVVVATALDVFCTHDVDVYVNVPVVNAVPVPVVGEVVTNELVALPVCNCVAVV